MFAEWSTAGIQATRATAPASVLVVVPDIGPEKIRAQLTEQKRQTDRRWPVMSLISLFSFLSCSCFLISIRNLQWCHCKSNNYRTTEDKSPDECCDDRAATTEVLAQCFERRVWCVCFEAYVFYQPASQATSRAPPFTPPERPMVMALKSVWNSWKDDTRKEKNGRAKVAWNKLASRRDRDQRAICFPFCELQAGASHCL